MTGRSEAFRLGRAQWHLRMIATSAEKYGRLDNDLTTVWVPLTEQQLACLNDFLTEPEQDR